MRITNNSTNAALQAAKDESKKDKPADGTEKSTVQSSPSNDSFSNSDSDFQKLLNNEPELGESYSFSNETTGANIDETGSSLGVYGTDQNDTITLKGDNNYIETHDGSDKVTVDGDNVTTKSGEGTDWIIASGADHTIDSGGGNDKVAVYANDSTVDLGEGTGRAGTGLGSISLGERFWIHGNDNEIDGTKTRSMGTIMGNGNTYEAGDMGDIVFVGNDATDNDVIGGDAKDGLFLDGGQDNRLYGGGGDDLITVGYSGFFTAGLVGEPSGNTVYGEAGNDDIRVMPFQDTTVHGGDDFDTLSVFMDYSEDMTFSVSSATERSEDGPVVYELKTKDGEIAVRFSGIEKLEFTNGIIATPGDNGIWEMSESG